MNSSGDVPPPPSTAASQPLDSASRDGSDAAPIRVGSPFAVDPELPPPVRLVEVVHDVGPLRYTAMGAVTASIMVIAFASVAAWWFPVGGALIAALGCCLSIFGLFSTFRITSAGLLTVHLGLFLFSYIRTLS